MPTYVYCCQACSDIVDELRPIDRRNDPMPCAKCGTMMTRTPTACSKPRADHRAQPTSMQRSGGAAVRIGKGARVLAHDNLLINCPRGFSVAKGAELESERNRFRDVGISYEFTDDEDDARGTGRAAATAFGRPAGTLLRFGSQTQR